MLKDVTLGRYYPNYGPLHKLDPRTKLLGLIVYAACVFIASRPASCIICLLALIALVALSRVPVRHMARGLVPLAFVLVFVAAMNIIFVEDGAWKATVIVLRMVELVAASNLVALTTRPKAFADGMEKSLSWLSALKVPVHDIATMVSIAFRFIPILSDEAKRIMEAQKARGADFKAKGLSRRALGILPVLVPLFSSAFRKAEELSDAMESRLYGSGKATSLNPLRYSAYDAASHILMFTFLAVVILLKVAAL